MASKTSKVSVVDRGTAGGKSYYKTDVTTLADGSVQRETYRTDANGNNSVRIQSVTVNSDGKVTKDDLSSNATVNEQRDLRNPKSQLRQGIKRQVDSAAGQLAEDNIDGVTKSTLDKAALGSGNAALNEVQTLDSLNTSNTTTQFQSTQKNTGTRKKFGELKFPLDLGSSTMDVIKFNMLEFKPRKTVNIGALGGFEDRKKNRQANNIGTVTLPVPAGIQDQNQAGWGDGRINPIQAAGVNFAMTAFNKGLGAAMSDTADKLGDIGANSGALKEGVKAYFTAAGVGVPLDQILARTQGQVLNPNLELLFNGPTLRPFNFTFKMSARSGDESKEIVRIIRFFKQGMSPQRTDSNLFVKAPHTFQLEYLHRGQGEHNFLNKFKECALIGMSVNYTPENNYATFEDGAMVSYEMQMQFKELDPVYNEDYTDLDQNADTQIGF